MGNEFFSTWDANTVEPSKPMDLLPEGDFLAMITAGEWKPTSSGTGERLNLTFDILDGPLPRPANKPFEFKGRKMWEGLNLKNPNAQAVEIAKADMSAICRAVGKMKMPNGLRDLYNIPLIIVVKHAKREDNGQMKNVIKGYKPKGSIAAAPAAAQRPTGPIAAPAVAKPNGQQVPELAAAGTNDAPWG